MGAVRSLRVVMAAILGIGLLLVLQPERFSASENTGLPLLDRLESAADRGDEWAEAILTQYRAFAASQGLTPEQLAAAGGDLAETNPRGPLLVTATGFAPFWARIDAQATFTTQSDLDSYVATRKLALMNLALAEPSRNITIALGFGQGHL